MIAKRYPLLFALNEEGSLVHVDKVENGQACKCTCPACGEALVAKQGKSDRIHHFAHASGKDCEHAYESSLHLAAKSILENSQNFVIPPIYVRFPLSNKESVLIQEETKIKIDQVKLEKRFDCVIPDVIVESDGKELFVEIFVTHRVDDEKLQKIKEAKISTLEIDLSDVDRNISLDELKSVLVTGTDKKTWVYNAKEELWYSYFLKSAIKLDVVSVEGMLGWRFVYDCPISERMWDKKKYASFHSDCSYCSYCIESHTDDNYILCSGKKRISDKDDFSTDSFKRQNKGLKKRYSDRLKHLEQSLRKGFSYWCPNCGCLLHEKTSKKGDYWGCSMYPQCRFVIWYNKESDSFESPHLKYK